MRTRAAREANGATAQSRECTVDAEIDKRETEKSWAARQSQIHVWNGGDQKSMLRQGETDEGITPGGSWGRKFGPRESAPERLGSAGATKSKTSLVEEIWADRWQRNVAEEEDDGMGGR